MTLKKDKHTGPHVLGILLLSHGETERAKKNKCEEFVTLFTVFKNEVSIYFIKTPEFRHI